VPWRRLGWVVWRRHRTTLFAIVTLLGLFGIYLVVSGLQMRSDLHTVQACTPQDSAACRFAWQGFHDSHSNPGILGVVFIFAPLLIGAFVGAPLVGRELETGTFRYAWTQGVGRTRWAIAVVVSGAVVLAALSGGFGVLVAWRDHPLEDADISSRLQGVQFPSTGLAIVGWTVAAYAVGVLAGLLWRRVLPAVVTTVALMFGLAFAASNLRLHYLTPVHTSSLDHPAGAQTLGQWWEKGGAVVDQAELNSVLRAAGVGRINVSGGGKSTPAVPGQGTDPISYLLHHGYTQWTSYQPDSRYWAFQWIEFGWLVMLGVTLLVAALVLLRRRDA
jgi:hypothetical protein